IFYDVWRPIFIGGGRDHLIENNLIVDSEQSILIDDRAYSLPDWFGQNMEPGSELWLSLDAVPYQEEPWSSRYPELASILDDNPGIPAGNSVQKNVIINSGNISTAEIVKETGVVENNMTLDEDPGFVDYSKRDFNLKPDSIVFDQVEGFEVIPFDEIGLYEGDERPSLPSLGTFNLQSPSQESNDVKPKEVLFSWDSSKHATAYRFVLALDSDFEQIVSDEIVDSTNITIQDLSEKTTYYWKVEAQINSNVINNIWNEEGVFSFTTTNREVNYSK